MKIHIIGIAGKTSAFIAQMFLDKGYQVSGSDHGCYPPMTEILDKLGVKYFTEYHADHITSDIDEIVVAGNALIVNPKNPEYLRAIELNIPIKTYPEILRDYVVKENSIVVAGNYGKGTVTGAIVFALDKLNQNPSYMVGGVLEDFTESVKASIGNYSVIEGDEYPTPPIGTNKPISKFFYYNPKYLVITSAEWDHYDQFPTEEEYINNYIKLVKNLPADGLLVANYDGENNKSIIAHAPCKVISYSLINPHADIVADKIGFNPALIGRFNVSNLTAAYALLVNIGFDGETVCQLLNSYRGLKQRMTVIHEHTDLVIVRDLAHSPIKAKSAIAACEETWPGFAIVSVLDIFSSSLKNREVLKRLAGALDRASTVFIPRVKISTHQDRAKSVTGKEIVNAIKKTQSQVEYVPLKDELIKKILKYPKPKVILLMSSGSMDGLAEELLKNV